MRAGRVMCAGTVAAAFASRSTGAAVALFVSVSSVRFALGMGADATLGFPAAWAAAAAPVLPFLACVLTMRLWARDSDFAQTELLLSAPVDTRTLVRGKFAGAWLVSLAALALYAAVPVAVLPFFAPPAAAPGAGAMAPAFAALALQSALWCAIGSFASAACGHSATAGAAALIATVCIPYAGFRAVLAWMPELRSKMASVPPVEHAIDIATGLVSVASVAGYAFFAAAALFAAARAIDAQRCAGAGRRRLRAALHVSSALAFLLAFAATAVLHRAGMSWEIGDRGKTGASAALGRACEAVGEFEAICFMSRKDPLHPSVARLMRGLERVAHSRGAAVRVSFVDPNWDDGPAAALAADGLRERSVVFVCGGRRLAVRAGELFPSAASGSGAMLRAEGVCAAAIRSLRPGRGRNVVYAVSGHGEAPFAGYDGHSLGTFARLLSYDGFEIRPLDLSAVPSVPTDCSVLAVAGARERFSGQELAKVDSYLRSGGRLFAAVLPRPGAGIAAYLRGWGCKVLQNVAVTPAPFAGTDVKATLPAHPANAQLQGAGVLFAHSAVLEPLAAGAGEADKAVFSPLALSGESCWGESDIDMRPWTFSAGTEPRGPLVLAAAIERGGSVSSDVGVRPARIVVVGDAGLASNSAIEKRGGANQAFLMNCFRWLAGVEPDSAAYAPQDSAASLPRPALAGFLAVSALAFPAAVFVLMFARTRKVSRRRRG